MLLNSLLSDRPRLPIHEWIAIVAIIVLLMILTVISLGSSDSNFPDHLNSPHHLISQEISIWIEGAVDKPGSYQVKRGATLQDVLALVKVKDDADLRRLKFHKKVRNGQVIKIPQIALITIFLEGEVETPGAVILPKGSILSDLIPRVKFHAEADVKKLNKKRRLKDGETICISKKKIKKRVSP